MTIVTKVGVSYDDHMNDDAPEVDSFSRGCYQALSSPRFGGESLGTRLSPYHLSLQVLHQLPSLRARIFAIQRQGIHDFAGALPWG